MSRDVRECDGGGLVKAQWASLGPELSLKSVFTVTVTQYSTPRCRYGISTSSSYGRVRMNCNTKTQTGSHRAFNKPRQQNRTSLMRRQDVFQPCLWQQNLIFEMSEQHPAPCTPIEQIILTGCWDTKPDLLDETERRFSAVLDQSVLISMTHRDIFQQFSRHQNQIFFTRFQDFF